MGLSYHFEFTAPADTTAEDLEAFLKGVEQLAKAIGFAPTTVLNVPFDNRERRDFARRLGGSYSVQDDRLKGVTLPVEGQIRDYDAISGRCRLIPERGVILVVTDEGGCETCFGFFRFPDEILDIHGRCIMRTGFAGAWAFRDFVDSPDPRYRAIVQQFEAAGYAKQVKDEYA